MTIVFPDIPLGHSIPSHRVHGWCSHCPGRSMAEELGAWQVGAMDRTTTTDDTQSDARIDEIRTRTDAATPGHWGTSYDGKGTYTVEARPRLDPRAGSVDEGPVATLAGEHGDEQTYRDARFIAHAREDVPYLLERLALVEALVADFIDPDPCHFDHHGYCQAHGWFATDPGCPHGRAKALGLEETEEDDS
ncbi:hypothetical protein [Streptomyces anulatus]|uniref:hypothetical protein n=1 Tax=Streptomyces anulatus TaxID=1892 RepID=UPI003248E6D0